MFDLACQIAASVALTFDPLAVARRDAEQRGVLMAYASRTGTRTTLASLKAHNWRLLVSATGAQRSESMPYALDNGAWTAHQKSRPFDVPLFVKLTESLGAGADWLVAPDIVGGGLESLALSLKWLGWCLERAPLVLLAAQDGIEPRHLAPYLSRRVGVAIGGSTEWKVAQLRSRKWADICAPKGAWLHCLRVNTKTRIDLCRGAGVISFDGTSAIMFPSTIPKIDRWRHAGAKRYPCLK